jgi:hypothetical protein
MDLKKHACGNSASCQSSVCVWGNRGDDNDNPVARQHLSNHCEASNVTISVRLRKTQARTEQRPHLISIKNLYLQAGLGEPSLKTARDCRFACTRESCQPDYGRCQWVLHAVMTLS